MTQDPAASCVVKSRVLNRRTRPQIRASSLKFVIRLGEKFIVAWVEGLGSARGWWGVAFESGDTSATPRFKTSHAPYHPTPRYIQLKPVQA